MQLISPQSLQVALVVAKATALLGAGALAALALRRASAGSRHLAWALTLGAVLALPALAALSPWRLEVLPRMEGLGAGSESASLSASASESASESASLSVSESASASESVSESASVSGSPSPSLPAAVLLLALWPAGALLVALRLLASHRAARRLVRAARPCTEPRAIDLLLDLSDRLDLAEPPRLLVSDAVEMPFAHGVLRPVLVLPAHAAGWDDERLSVVLLHELAHVRRRDPAAHALARLACAAWWFHPLAWWAAARLRAEAERAADDHVLACGTRPSDYASHLVEILATVRRPGAPAAALAMARVRELEGRLVALLDPAVRRGAPGLAARAGLAGALAALLAVSALASPISVDEVSGGRPFVAAAVSTAAAPAPAPAEAARPRGDERARKAPTKAEERVHERVREKIRERVREAPLALAEEEDVPASTLSPVFARVLASDPDAGVRRAAAWALARGGRASAAAPLAAALRGDADAETREMAAWALAGNLAPAGGAALGEAVRKDGAAEVRRTAVWALGGRRDADAGVLVAAAADRDAAVREVALWALGQRGAPGAAGAAARALRDPDRDVRLAAAWALGEVRDPASVPALRSAFDAEEDGEVKEAAFRALALLGDAGPELLEKVLAAKDPELRARAVAMLAGRGPGAWPWPWPRPDPRPMP